MNKFIKDRAGRFEITPKEGNWEAIEKRIEPKKKKRFLWIIIPVIFLAGYLVGIQSSVWNKDKGLAIKKEVIVEERKPIKQSFTEGEKDIKPKSNISSDSRGLAFETVANEHAKASRGAIISEHPPEKMESNRANENVVVNRESAVFNEEKLTLSAEEKELEEEIIEVNDPIAILDQKEKDPSVLDSINDPIVKKVDNFAKKPRPVNSPYAVYVSYGYGVTNYTHRKRNITNISPTAQQVGEYFSAREKDSKGFGSSIEIGLLMRLNKKMEIGVSFGQQKYRWSSVVGDTINRISFVPLGNNSLKAGERAYSVIGTKELNTELTSYSIGVFGQRQLYGKGLFSLTGRMGIDYQRIADASALTYDIDKAALITTDENSQMINQNVIGLSLSLPFEFKLAEKFTFGVAPIMSTTLNSVYDSEVESRYPYRIGLSGGIKVSL